jgi:DNA-directed RNA polymerase specialized sigma24 family protein
MMLTEPIAVPVQAEAVTIADPSVIEELQADRGQALFGFARRLGLTDEQASDAVQETLLRLWRELRRGRPVEDRAAWAFRTIYRIAMDEHRLSRRVAGLRSRLLRSAATSARAERLDRDERLTVWSAVTGCRRASATCSTSGIEPTSRSRKWRPCSASRPALHARSLVVRSTGCAAT